MVDRVSLFPDDGTYPGYTVTEPEVLTQEQYQAGPTNYFAQVLGPKTGSLEEETGIGVRKAPEVGEEVREDDPSPQAPSAILAATRPTLGGDISASGKISFDIPATAPLGAESYSDFLKKKGMGDRIPLVNIYEGMAYDDKEVNLFENIGAAIKEGGKKAADPKKAKASLLQETVNAFGNESFRGFGIAGAAADMVHSIQYRDMDAIRAARIADPYGDTGFAMTLGEYGITRAPGGKTYTGNMQGMDHETVRALEAISKGYDPTRGRYNMLDPRKSQTVVDSGGLQVSSNPMDGFIRANGTVYDPRFIGAAGGASGNYARSDMIKKAADTYLSHIGNPKDRYDAMSDILADARAGKMTVGQAIRGIQFSRTKYDYSGGENTGGRSFDLPNPYADKDDGGYDPSTDYGFGYGGTEDRDDDFDFDDFDAADQDFSAQAAAEAPYADEFDYYRQGGRVGLAMGGAPRMASGFVERPPDQVPEDQTVADDKKTRLPEGAFVINAAAAEFMGTDDVRTMLLDAHKEALRRGIVVDKQGSGAKLIDVAISRGEVVVAPHLAKIIGYDRLNKINNRGKPETRERIQENGQPQVMQARSGGFISRYDGGDVSMRYAGPLSTVELMKSGLNVTAPVSQGFIKQEPFDTGPVPTGLDDTAHGYRIGDVMAAIQAVETKGYENKNGGYIFTKSDKKGKRSSAFGPHQITGETVADLLKRNSNVARQIKFDPGFGDYINAYIAQGIDVVNIRNTGKKYVGPEDNRTPVKISNAVKKLYGPLGAGEIPRELHEKYYPMLAELVVKQKASDADSFDEWIKSYGNNTEAYLKKVKAELENMARPIPKPKRMAGGGFLDRKKFANGGEVDFEYEDKIIRDEVARKMKVMLEDFAKKTGGEQVYTENFEEGSIDQEFFQRFGRMNDMTELKGDYGVYGYDVNAPTTPTLVNLFALAEELAHVDYFHNPEKFQRENPHPRGTQAYRIFENESDLLEEIRAKQIAFDTVKGLFPKDQKFAQYTLDNYKKAFRHYLDVEKASPEIIAEMTAKYGLDDVMDVDYPMGQDNAYAYELTKKRMFRSARGDEKNLMLYDAENPTARIRY